MNSRPVITVFEPVRNGDTCRRSTATIFSHLTDIVDPKVRASIDCLPLPIEGYQRAKIRPNVEVYGNNS